MTTGQMELPLPGVGEGCLTFSLGQRCRYFHNHDGDHTFGGGMHDPVHLRRCDQLEPHLAHAWDDDTVWACSGVS